MPKSTKYIFVIGSVMSGLGKGILTSAIGKILQLRGKTISLVKIDPYLNIDAGTMSPFEHGEVFVTEDGGELDVDFGHYERFLGIPVKKRQNITTGQIYYSVIEKERQGHYLGHTVQVVPHIIDEIILRLEELEKEYTPDVMLIELGGTVGDIESQPFLEAIRQLNWNKPDEDVLIILLAYVPFPPHLQEHKTKPTQHSVRELRASGIKPEIIVCRSEVDFDKKTLRKIAFSCDVPEDAVLSLPNLENVFNAPKKLDEQGISQLFRKHLKLDLIGADWSPLEDLILKINSKKDKLVIGIPGKYTDLSDSYISVNEALKHAAYQYGYDVELRHISTESFEEDPSKVDILENVDGVLVPGGFGDRGTEGKILSIKYSRENNIPFLGICLGFQLAIVEYARHVIGLEMANSTEMNKDTKYPVVCLQEDQKHLKNLGGTMRLGAYPVTLKKGTKIYELYNEEIVNERHRHRYEVNSQYFDKLQDGNLIFTGFWNNLVETMELKDHEYFIGVQYHPEFKSNPWKPSPPYRGLILAAIERHNTKIKEVNVIQTL